MEDYTMRKKHFIGFVLASLVLAVPALAGNSNGFESDYCYALTGGAIDMLDQADGSYVGSFPVSGETFCFSNSQVAGANSPAFARLFTASRYKLGTKYDEIVIKEYDSSGQEIRRSYLGRWWHGAPNKTLNYPDNTKDLVVGTIRYNAVNDTLIVSANVANKHKQGAKPSKAWEFALPDWPAGTPSGGGVQLIHEYTLLTSYKNRCNIALNPHDGTMYATSYNYNSGGSGTQACIGSTPTNPPNGVNTVLLDGVMYKAHCADGQHYQPSAITYRDAYSAGAIRPELNTCNESTWTVYQPYSWSWELPGVCVGNMPDKDPHPILSRISTPGGCPTCINPNRIRGIRAATDPYTGELFMVGNGGKTGNGGGVLQVPVDDRINHNAQILGGQGAVYADADSPMPTPPLEVTIDILPSDDPNLFTVNTQGKGRLPIAILGSESYDVNDIDLDSLNIAGVLPVKAKVGDDENGDGINDLMMHYSRRDLIVELGLELLDCNGAVVTVTVDGALLSGRVMYGSDDITLQCRMD